MVMNRRIVLLVLGGLLAVGAWVGSAQPAHAQDASLNRFYYYPYYYFPHNYWPNMGPKWPEAPGSPYMRPPAYMAHPPFQEPHWRYELGQNQNYYRGFHFWLDQF
jgi:hypothetical protein